MEGRNAFDTPFRIGPGALPYYRDRVTDPTPLHREKTPSGLSFSRRDVLRWIYVGRLTLVTGILAGALRAWLFVQPQTTLVATVMFLVAWSVTGASFWYTNVLRRTPGENFVYAQLMLDISLVTGIIHITGGPQSNFSPLYILVISAGALLLPLYGGVLIGALASIVYFADVVWGYQGALQIDVALQLVLFAVVALLTGLVGDRLRRAGVALGEVESALRQLRLDTSDILANLSTGVLTVDGEGRLAYTNPAGEALLGLPAREWLGRPVLDEMERAAPGMGRIMREAISSGTRVGRFRTVVRRDGKDVALGISTAVLERAEEGAPSVTAIFQDITDLERLDLLDRRAQRLEAVAELSASLAHEIKNPLASIRSAVEQLSRSPLSEEDRAVLERLVLGESDRLSRLLSEFLEFSGVQMGVRNDVDLSSVVNDCVALLRQDPTALAGVEVAAEGSDRPVWIWGDADLLHRAVFNLVLNAVQFAGEGGRVSVSVRVEGEHPHGGTVDVPCPVALSVRDSGPGVDPEVVGRIFDPFFTTRPGGNGLGLSVVHRSVAAHDGAILVERAPGGGAEFVILLPGLPRE